MSVSLEWEGLEELRAALRHLPAELTGDGRQIIEAHGRHVLDVIAGKYPERSGDLKAGLSVSTLPGTGQFFAGVLVKNRVKYAEWWDYGSQGKKRIGRDGRNRGVMPPGRVFTPSMIQERRAMWPDLRGLLERNGLVASGEGDT